MTSDEHDVVVVGGGAAGLSGALVLARSRRSVVVVDGGQPRNAPAAGVHGFLTRDGMSPAELLRVGREEVTSYGGSVLDGHVETVERAADGRLVVVLAGGRRLTARRLLVATGLVDELPDVPGVAERWGRDVLHCPYCHGWEVRDQAVAVLASGPMSVHQALLFRQLTDDLVYLSGEQPLGEEQAEQLRALGVRVVPGAVEGLRVEDDRLTGVRLAGGAVVPCTAAVVATRMRARTGFLAGLGLLPAEHPSGIAEHLAVDATGRTSAPGVWAAGNAADPSAQVGASAAAGAFAAAQINGDLVLEDTRRAVEAARFDAASWEERYRGGQGAGRSEPGPALVAEAVDLAPGTALDAGCGTGADARWLADRGWQVTAVDVSATAVELARGSSAAVDWQQADLTTWEPAQRYDLVTSSYVHAPGPPQALFGRLATWVAPGGTLLVTGHAHGDHASSAAAHVALEQVTGVLREAEWEVLVAEPRRHVVHGRPLSDVVVRARRRVVPAATGRP